MNPDFAKDAWQAQTSQTRLTIEAELLLKEVRRNQHFFDAMVFWRDVREMGVSLLMVPAWIYMGLKLSLPWTWYLTVPAVVWIFAFMLAHRVHKERRSPQPDESLTQHLQHSLTQVARQIWLLRNVFWWYLLPLVISTMAFFGQLAWESREGGWWTALSLAGAIAVEFVVCAAIYRLNQYAVRSELEPRRRELEALLASLKD